MHLCVRREVQKHVHMQTFTAVPSRGVDYLCFSALFGFSYISHLVPKNYSLNLFGKQPVVF